MESFTGQFFILLIKQSLDTGHFVVRYLNKKYNLNIGDINDSNKNYGCFIHISGGWFLHEERVKGVMAMYTGKRLCKLETP
jgi:hypothetical protein